MDSTGDSRAYCATALVNSERLTDHACQMAATFHLSLVLSPSLQRRSPTQTHRPGYHPIYIQATNGSDEHLEL